MFQIGFIIYLQICFSKDNILNWQPFHASLSRPYPWHIFGDMNTHIRAKFVLSYTQHRFFSVSIPSHWTSIDCTRGASDSLHFSNNIARNARHLTKNGFAHSWLFIDCVCSFIQPSNYVAIAGNCTRSAIGLPRGGGETTHKWKRTYTHIHTHTLQLQSSEHNDSLIV